MSSQNETSADAPQPAPTLSERIRTALISWEIYPLILIAAFLRLWNIDKAIFGQDEADVYELARNAIVHGLLPLTSNRASIGNLNPPMVVYFFMLPALFSANPLWGQVLVALLNTLAVLLTYFFVRRYYGRLAGTIAAGLFATAVSVWMYSRYIWSPNVEPFLVVIFIWLLFRGVVERRKGWLAPALVVLGILYQLHGSTLYLAIPLCAAVLLAYKTLRWRDLAYTLAGLLLIFSPFLVWEFHNNFFDLKLMLTTAQEQAEYNFTALRNYLFFIHPTLINPYNSFSARTRDNHLLFPNAQSVLLTTPLHYIHLLLSGSYGLALLFLFGGMALAAALILFPRIFVATEAAQTSQKQSLLRWWKDFLAAPARQGLLLLLLWQLAPLVLFVRHSIVLFDHYFIFLLPGQFIFMAIAVVEFIKLVQTHRPAWERWTRYGMSALAALIILAQLIGTGGTLVDLTVGHYDYTSVSPNYVDLHSQQNALLAADQLAQQRGIHRIYITADHYTYDGLIYLAGQMKTPVELNNISMIDNSLNCFILPDVSAGPVVMLAEPDAGLSTMLALIGEYTNATLISEPQHLGGAPYRLYILTARPSPAPIAQSFAQGLQALTPSASFLPGTRLLTTRWRITATQSTQLRTLYHYDFQMQEGSTTRKLDCQPTATWAGDQLFLVQNFSTQPTVPAQIGIQVSTFISQPTLIQAGPLTLTSFYDTDTPIRQLLAPGGQSAITFPVATTP